MTQGISRSDNNIDLVKRINEAQKDNPKIVLVKINKAKGNIATLEAARGPWETNFHRLDNNKPFFVAALTEEGSRIEDIFRCDAVDRIDGRTDLVMLNLSECSEEEKEVVGNMNVLDGNTGKRFHFKILWKYN